MKNWIGVRGVLMLVCGALAATVAHAAPADPVTIEVRGVPSGSAVQVAIHAINGVKVLDNATGSVAADFMSDAKPVTTYIDTCMGKVFVTIVEDGGLPPPEEDDCDRRTIAGWRWRAGNRLVVDAGRGTIVGDTQVARADDGTRTGWTPYVSVGLGGASFSNANTVVETLTGRYQAANYTQSSANVDRRDTAFNVNAGVRFGLSSRIGLEAGAGYGRGGGASLDTNGTRTLGDLKFALDSSFSTSRWGAEFGVPVGVITNRFEIVPTISRYQWRISQTVNDALTAGGQQVRGGTTTTSRDGGDWSYGVKLRMVDERWGIEFRFEHVELDDAFEPNASAGWPTNVVQNQITGGVVLYPFGR